MLPLTDNEIVSEPDPLDLIAADRNLAVLDEELNQLPEKYRNVLVLTYFSGRTSQQIADQLAESKGAIDGRLRQARNVLRIRLARRGVEIGVLVAATSLMKTVAAATPASLIESTILLGTGCLGHPISSPADLSRLEPLIKPEVAMISTKSMSLVVGCMALVAGAVGIGQLPFSSAVGQEAAEAGDQTIDARLTEDAVLQSESVASVVVSNTPGAASPVAEPRSAGSQTAATAKTQYSGFSSRTTRETTELLHEQLEQECPQLDFPGSVSLEDVLNQIADHVSTTSNVRFAIVPDLAELQLEGIENLRDIQVTDIVMKGVTLRSALDHIFAQTNSPRLDYIIKNEMVLITSEGAAEIDENMFNRFYNVERQLTLFGTDWASSRQPAKPANAVSAQGYPRSSATDGMKGSGMGMSADMPSGAMGMLNGAEMGYGSMGASSGSGKSGLRTQTALGASSTERAGLPSPQTPESQLLETIKQLTVPVQWSDPETDENGGRMVLSGKLLMVRQSRRGHVAVADVLEQLEESAILMLNE